MFRSRLLALLLLAAMPGLSWGQAHPAKPIPSPLLYVRFVGLPAARATYYPGTPTGHELEAGSVVGLRPGYIYRVKIGNIAGHPDWAIYPTLEVRGTLQLPAQLRAANYPTPIPISQEDVERALAGVLLTKVIYLEHPEKARPVATRPDQPLETPLRPSVNLLDEARALGRPVLIVRLGGRSVSQEELTGQGIAGTILFPSDKMLGPPAVKPWVPWSCLPVYDPIAGCRPPEEECLRDGGDAGLPAGLDAQGRLHGVEPADTVAVYTDSKGGRHIAVSNPVCLCVPRFAVFLTATVPAGYDTTMTVEANKGLRGQVLMQTRVPALLAKQTEQLAAVVVRERPSMTENTVGTIDIEQIQGRAEIIGHMHGELVSGTLVQKTPVPPDRPLLLCKWADRQAAQVGDVVTFHLKFTNQGGQPISDVVVTDSLTGRLEYVPGSSRADRETIFTMQQNEAGSLLLQWQVVGRLQPRESGEITFQARIR
jgi:uncharacterized repeat protein (TIGR01451 family)